jgi:hypothetical protein
LGVSNLPYLVGLNHVPPPPPHLSQFKLSLLAALKWDKHQ